MGDLQPFEGSGGRRGQAGLSVSEDSFHAQKGGRRDRLDAMPSSREGSLHEGKGCLRADNDVVPEGVEQRPKGN